MQLETQQKEQSFVGKFWPLLLVGGILFLSAAGPEYLHRKYGRRGS